MPELPQDPYRRRFAMVNSATGRAVATCDGTVGEAVEAFVPAACSREGMNALRLNENPGEVVRLLSRPVSYRWWHLVDLGHVLDQVDRTKALALEFEGLADELDGDLPGERWARMAFDSLAADALIAAEALERLEDHDPDPDRSYR